MTDLTETARAQGWEVQEEALAPKVTPAKTGPGLFRRTTERLRAALISFLKHVFEKKSAAPTGTSDVDIPDGHARIFMSFDQGTTGAMKRGEGFVGGVRVQIPEPGQIRKDWEKQKVRERKMGNFELRSIDPTKVRALGFYTFDPTNPAELKPENIGSSWAGNFSSFKSIQEALDRYARDKNLVAKDVGFYFIYQVREAKEEKVPEVTLGARLTAAKRLDVAGFREPSKNFSRGESDRIIKILGEDDKSGFSQVAGDAFVVAAPAQVKIGNTKVPRPVIHSVNMDERQRNRGAHGELFLASAEAMKSKNMPNSFWEITVTDSPEVKNQLEIAKSLGYLLPDGQPIREVGDFVKAHQGKTIRFAVKTDALLKNAQAVKDEIQKKRKLMDAFGADPADREAMLELDWPVVRDGLRYLWHRDRALPRNLKSLKRVGPLIALEREARGSENRARTMDISVRNLETTTTPLTPLDRENLKRYKETAPKERKKAIAKRNQALTQLLAYRNELGIPAAPAAPAPKTEPVSEEVTLQGELDSLIGRGSTP
ncbi:MAG: hypothetical protein ACREH5_03075, partial [Candidatus Omnitrophota bacterium]